MKNDQEDWKPFAKSIANENLFYQKQLRAYRDLNNDLRSSISLLRDNLEDIMDRMIKTNNDLREERFEDEKTN